MKKRLISLSAALVVAVALAAQATAQNPNRPWQNVVRATGEATVTALPDQAEINVGVVTQAETADRAAAENARKVDAVLAAVKGVLEPTAEVKTIGYSVSPVYVYPREGGEPRITGYQASNTVRVKTGDLGRVGSVIDAATKAGANNIQGLQFTLKDDTAVRAEALAQAARKARSQAQAIATALGVVVSGIVYAEETSAPVRPLYADVMEARTAAATKTPVEPGTIEVNATVTIALGIAGSN